MDPLVALGAGALAGLALAVPLGAIGVLLVQEGATRGWAKGTPAAAAVASVDVLYCGIAVGAGSVAVPLIVVAAPWPQVVSGVILIAIAAVALLRSGRVGAGTPTTPTARPMASWRRYLLFLGLTAINPATLVYFGAVVTGLTTVTGAGVTAAAFIAGVGSASLTWQVLLVGAGALTRSATGDRWRRGTALVGSGVVGVLGVIMIAAALR